MVDIDMYTEEGVRKNTFSRECLLGIVGDGFVIVAADGSTGYRFFGPATTRDKIEILDSHKLFATSGTLGDRSHFVDHIKTKLALPENHSHLNTVASAADFIRHELATTSLTGKKVDVLLAGYDQETGPSLYRIDYTASLEKIEKGAFGVFGSTFSLSTINNHFHSKMSLQKAIDLVAACIEELRSGMDVDSKHYFIKIVDKDGATEYAFWQKHIEN